MGPTFSVNGYEIHERLGTGAMGEVYRATHRLSREDVALKRVLLTPTPEASQATAKDASLALLSEFQTLASLHHPHIIRVLDYGFDHQQRPFFTMELLRNPQTILQAATHADMAVKVSLLAQLLQALVYLHRRGVMHRDIKPSNIIVVHGQVKLTDFGVATVAAGEAHVAGTLAYMAPEILHGGPATPATDLYAAGLVAFSVVYGGYPFDMAALEKIMGSTLSSNAGPTTQPAAARALMTLATEAAEVPTELLHTMQAAANNMARVPDGPLAPLIARLMHRDVGERYHDARQALADLARLSDRPLSSESVDTRESFLQASVMLGRQREINQLALAIQKTCEGQGSGWLIGGESGVGKSRLLDELRVRALVSGLVVTQGQAISEGGLPYAPWRAPLRQLCVQIAITDAQASTLSDLVPDIAELLQRSVAPEPNIDGRGAPIDPQVAQARLFATVEQVLRASPRPLLMVLEDLQWAGPESLDLLRFLAPHLPQLPILIAGSYRHDEAPELVNQLPGMESIKLSRLSAEDTAALAESMLGPQGRDAQLVAFLHRETEGNVFFMIEVMRTLAEQAGTLDKISGTSLPESVVTGGMRRLLQNRLAAIPQADQDVLHFAAVSGRYLDLTLLAACAPQHPLDAWLFRCANAAVLEMHHGSWRFAHDKLREAILASLSEAALVHLNQRLAESIESIYGADIDHHAGRLALHWGSARRADKATEYFVQAGELSERGHAHATARTQYLAAIAALDLQNETMATRRRRADVVALYAQSAWSADPPDRVMARLHDAEARLMASPEPQTDDDRRRLARLHLWTGRILSARNEVSQAIEFYRKALVVGEALGDEDLIALPSVTIGQAVMVRGYFGQWELVKRGLEYMRRRSSFVEMVRAMGYVGTGLAAVGRIQEGEVYVTEHYDRAVALNNPRAIAFSAIYRALVRLAAGDNAGAIRMCAAIIEGAHRSGDRILEFIGFGFMAWSQVRHQRHTEAVRSIGRAKELHTALGGKVLLDDLVAAAEAETLLATAPVAQALQFAQALATQSAQTDHPLSQGLAERVVALGTYRQNPNHWAAAQTHFQQSVDVLTASGNLMEVARTQLAWAQTAKHQGDHGLANNLLQACVKQYAFAGEAPPTL